MLTKFQKSKIKGIINENIHGAEFYTKQMFDELVLRVGSLLKELGINAQSTKEYIINSINDYMMENVKISKQYFDEYGEDKLKFRTAHAALVQGEAVCVGFTEACRILLECCGFQTYTLLSRLPEEEKDLLHYVTVVKYDRGSGRDHYVLDPERQSRCGRKNIDARQYLLDMTYTIPNELFCKHKLDNYGCGLRASQYLPNVPSVKGKNQVDKLIEYIKLIKNGGKI